MPAAFEQCRAENGSKIRTVSGPDKHWGLKAGQYMHVCITKGGAVFRGEVKEKQEES